MLAIASGYGIDLSQKYKLALRNLLRVNILILMQKKKNPQLCTYDLLSLVNPVIAKI